MKGTFEEQLMRVVSEAFSEAFSEACKELGIEYPETTEEKAEKKFTQAEVNDIIKKRLSKADINSSKKELLNEIKRLAKQKDFTDAELKKALNMIMAYRRNSKER